MATTVPCAESDILVPMMLVCDVRFVIVTLVIGAFAGGHGGLLGNVMLKVIVWPGLALPPGATEPVESVVVPAPSYEATLVRATR